MDKSSEHTPVDRHLYHQVPIHGLDFSRQDPPSPEPKQEKQTKKVVHTYTLHARSNDRLKDLVASSDATPQMASPSAKG